MKHKTTWQKCYDIESEIEYLEEENSGEHYFSIVRRENENFFDPEDDECYALVQDGKLVGYEGYSNYPSQEERDAMERILMEKNIIQTFQQYIATPIRWNEIDI